MRRLAVLLACALAAASCRRTEPAASAPPPAGGLHDDSTLRLENHNLLNLVFGATVIDRDNEIHYEASAAHAIDGTALTSWISAPGGAMRAVVSLAADTRLERLGAAVLPTNPAAHAMLHFETSRDGATWSKALDLPIRLDTAVPQTAAIQPVVARYLRVSFDSPDYEKAILSLQAIGKEVAPYVQPPIEGCWEINGEPARFSVRGASVAGVIGKMPVTGGTDGRAFRLMWLDGPMWGYAAVSTGADGQHLSGVRWHEEINPKHNGDGWFGRRVPCAVDAKVDEKAIVDATIRRSGMWRLYGIRFDLQDRILAAESAPALDLLVQLLREHATLRFKIIAREFRSATDAQNRARCQTKLNAMRDALRARGADLSRIEFVNAGTAIHPLNIAFTSQKVMDSGVDLQVAGR